MGSWGRAREFLPPELLGEIMAAGGLISATPAHSYSPAHQEAIKVSPLDRILLETDAPTVYREKILEPADLIITARELSPVKGLDLQQVIEITTRNAKMFFGF
jgi:TatD DNase family protein